MKITVFPTPVSAPLALALGYFDSLHIGHRAILRALTDYARAHRITPAVLTFRDGADKSGAAVGQVYALPARMRMMSALGVERVLVADFSRAFRSTAPQDFLYALTKNYRIAALFCGGDYRYGKDGAGDVGTLGAYCAQKAIALTVVPFVTDGDGKVSTTRVRDRLAGGEVEAANLLLGAPYTMTGIVCPGHRKGTDIGFPTANLPLSPLTDILRRGVYFTAATVDGVTYKGITNVGGRPTFSDETPGAETHMLGAPPTDYYGKVLSLQFLHFWREITNFSDISSLQAQLARDKKAREEYPL
ncbi:MAG: riboflavin biosynthesis protein RibF [Clostridiales bacterium]|jgi:riboflavin kinase/FMN adenylyltransferase|nr:riboflavin biosynthesis protein RibF [Clostridiales bacterium]